MNPKKEPGGKHFEVTHVASGGASEVLKTKAVAFETVRGAVVKMQRRVVVGHDDNKMILGSSHVI